MKNEHELLHEVCKKIGYDTRCEYSKNEFNSGLIVGYYKRIGYERRLIDVREIIFTPEFLLRYMGFLFQNPEWTENKTFNEVREKKISFYKGLYNNLDNPSLYLYNLLFEK